MNVNDGALNYEMILNNKRFQAALKEAARDAQGFSTQVERSTSNVETSFNRLAVAAAGFFSIQAASRFVSQMVKVRGEFQQLGVAMTTMLGNKEKADSLMAQLIKTAAITPFNLTDVARGAKQLLAYGTAADEVNDTLNRLGNVASGLSVPLGDIVYLYGTLQSQGRAYAVDIRQFAGRGVPIYAELAKVLGIAKDKVQAYVEAGKVGFPEVEKAFKNMTNEGGMFFNLMEKQSQTITGQLSNLGDAFDRMLNDMGTQSQGVINATISGLATLIENYKTVLGILADVAAMYGAYKAALIAFTIVQAQSNKFTEIAAIYEGRLTVLRKLQVFWIEAETASMAALNKVMLANPYAFVAAAVVGLAGAYIILRDNTTSAQKATKELNDEEDRRNEQIEAQKQKTSDLVNIIKSETSTKFAQMQAYKQLQSIYPAVLKNMDLLKFKNSDLTKSQKDFNGAIETSTLKSLQDQYADLQKEVQNYQATLQRVENNPNLNRGGLSSQIKDNLSVAASKAELLRDKIQQMKQGMFEANATDAQKLNYYNKQLAALKNQQSQLEKNLTVTQSTGNALLDWKRTIESIALNGLTSQIEGVMAKINGLMPGASKSNRQQIDSAMSLADLAEVRKTIQAAYDSATDATQRKQIAADLNYADQRKKSLDVYAATNAAANKRMAKSDQDYANKKKDILDQINKLNEDNYRKSLTQNDAEVQAVKDKYADILKAIEEYNKKAPAGHRIGAGTVTALQQSEQRAIGTTQYQQQTEAFKTELDKQKVIFQDYEDWKRQLGSESADQRYGKDLEGFKSYTDYVRAQMAVLMAQTMTMGSMTPAMQQRFAEFKKILAEAEREAKRSNDQILKDALASSESAQEKILAIKRKYQEQSDALQKSGNLTDVRKSVIDENAQKEIDAVINDVLSKENDLKTAGDAIAGVTKSQIRSQIESLRQYLQSAADLTQNQRDRLQAVIQSLSIKMLTATDNTTTSTGRQDLPEGFDQLQDLETTIGNVKAEIAATMSQIGKLSTTVGAAANPKIKELMEHADVLKKQLDDLNRQRLGALATAFGGIADIIAGIGDDISGLNSGLGGILSTIGNIGKSASGAFGGIKGALDQIKKITTSTKDGGLGGLGTIFSGGKANGGGLLGGISSIAGMIGPIGAGIGAAVKGITSIFAMGKKVKEANAKARAEIKAWYADAERGETEYQALLRKRALDNAKANKTTYAGLIATMDEAKKQLPDVEKAYDALYAKLQGEQYISGKGYKHGTLFRKTKTWDIMASLYGDSYDELEEKYSKGLLKDGAKADFEELQKLRQELDDLGVDAEQAKQQLGEMLTGLDVDSFSDKIFDVIKQGASAFDQLGTTIEDIIRTAVENGFKYKVVEQYLSPLLDDLQNHMIDGTANQGYLEQFKQRLAETGGVLNAMWAPIENMLDTAFPGSKDGATKPGLTGQIKSITQDQVSELAGLQRLNVDTTKRMLATMQDSNAMFNKQLSELVGIRVNTANTVSELKSAVVELKQINANTKPQKIWG